MKSVSKNIHAINPIGFSSNYPMDDIHKQYYYYSFYNTVPTIMMMHDSKKPNLKNTPL
jgi:hypothetical protein